MGKNQRNRKQKKLEEEKKVKEIIQKKLNDKDYWSGFWRRSSFWLYTACLILIIAYPFLVPSLNKIKNRGRDEAVLHTNMGDITVELFIQDAPNTAQNFIKHAQDNYYNGLTFHRVIKDFMIQGGDPKGDGTGGEGAYSEVFDDEINASSLGLENLSVEEASFLSGIENEEDLKSAAGMTVKKYYESKGYVYNNNLKSHKMTKGSLAMANSGPNTNGSQFFIVTGGDMPHLDGRHTVFGQVKKGMDVAIAISEVSTTEQDNKPTSPVIINSIEIK